MKAKSISRLSAFTLIEVLAAIGLLGIITVGSLVALDSIADDANFDKTYARMNQIKIAMIGDLDTNKTGSREYFGYLGDIGSLPSTLQGIQALISRPAGVSAWAVNSTSKTGMGWRGPYLKSTTGVNWFKDAWGSDFVYDGTAGTLTSYGSDKAAGGTGYAADIVFTFGSNLTTSTVSGVIVKNGVVFNGDAIVQLYEPNGNGALNTSSTRTLTLDSSDNGAFSFSNVKMGHRSIKITFPSATTVVGPVLLSVDKENFLVSSNYLDTAPGELPHLCADIDNVLQSRDPASLTTPKEVIPMTKSATTNRVYFDLDIINSFEATSVFVQTNTLDNIAAIRIGNTVFDCSDKLICKVRDNGNDQADDNNTHESKFFPEIAFSVGWQLKKAERVASYIQFGALDGSVTPDIANIDFVQLRLGCRIITIQ